MEAIEKGVDLGGLVEGLFKEFEKEKEATPPKEYPPSPSSLFAETPPPYVWQG